MIEKKTILFFKRVIMIYRKLMPISPIINAP